MLQTMWKSCIVSYNCKRGCTDCRALAHLGCGAIILAIRGPNYTPPWSVNPFVWSCFYFGDLTWWAELQRTNKVTFMITIISYYNETGSWQRHPAINIYLHFYRDDPSMRQELDQVVIYTTRQLVAFNSESD